MAHGIYAGGGVSPQAKGQTFGNCLIIGGCPVETVSIGKHSKGHQGARKRKKH